ncbi:hypothetical protein CEUSTIGMA_g7946.t1 [Chlamydomonas eustigma]|uniref:JmjC domain-containing protein n=1 Tax=Chlamydomonas eustigma TaxID=1157962 RepID=A0A250XBQ2_9CHLO|nr:hypothetical protein CEUSTIGMA_g7946.t1 [Chlamydomonas eustigma]|eukprot:GAX80508.1 hypothetical protein CEUSTIGMA_g7946.t1 [Chlamydomonas eustigma]
MSHKRNAQNVPTFYPTIEDMNKPFEAFIEKHENKIGAVGLAKIVPPVSWNPRLSDITYESEPDVTIERCIKQVATGSRGLYRFLLVEQKPMSLKDTFMPHALAEDNQPGSSDPAEVERKYWRTVGIRPPLYGADILGSLFDKHCRGWTLQNLDTMLSRTLRESGHDLPGVSSPYLYYGMWRSTFAWHCEDLDLYSVNYLHYGASKHWYCIPPEYRVRFENLVKSLLPDIFKACPEFMRHKELLISPQMLDLHNIPYVKAVQGPRDFMITFPGAYHAGFNAGFNCAESVNFGTRRWIPIGARAGVCKCSPDSVKIDMRLFRHLVPIKDLPPDLLIDTSDDEMEELSEQVEKERVAEIVQGQAPDAAAADDNDEDVKKGSLVLRSKHSRNCRTSHHLQQGRASAYERELAQPAAFRACQCSYARDRKLYSENVKPEQVEKDQYRSQTKSKVAPEKVMGGKTLVYDDGCEPGCEDSEEEEEEEDVELSPSSSDYMAPEHCSEEDDDDDVSMGKGSFRLTGTSARGKDRCAKATKRGSGSGGATTVQGRGRKKGTVQQHKGKTVVKAGSVGKLLVRTASGSGKPSRRHKARWKGAGEVKEEEAAGIKGYKVSQRCLHGKNGVEVVEDVSRAVEGEEVVEAPPTPFATTGVESGVCTAAELLVGSSRSQRSGASRGAVAVSVVERVLNKGNKVLQEDHSGAVLMRSRRLQLKQSHGKSLKYDVFDSCGFDLKEEDKLCEGSQHPVAESHGGSTEAASRSSGKESPVMRFHATGEPRGGTARATRKRCQYPSEPEGLLKEAAKGSRGSNKRLKLANNLTPAAAQAVQAVPANVLPSPDTVSVGSANGKVVRPSSEVGIRPSPLRKDLRLTAGLAESENLKQVSSNGTDGRPGSFLGRLSRRIRLTWKIVEGLQQHKGMLCGAF